MKKGFTLIEVMAVLTVVGLLSLIIIPIVSKNIEQGREEFYQVQLNSIIIAAQSWGVDHMDELPTNDGEMMVITLSQLKIDGYIDKDLKNPKTDTLFPNEMEIEIIKKVKNYEYKIREVK